MQEYLHAWSRRLPQLYKTTKCSKGAHKNDLSKNRTYMIHLKNESLQIMNISIQIISNFMMFALLDQREFHYVWMVLPQNMYIGILKRNYSYSENRIPSLIIKWSPPKHFKYMRNYSYYYIIYFVIPRAVKHTQQVCNVCTSQSTCN